jgi:hypothetical protein
VTELREQLYDRLDGERARVVILGGPGAGKTAAMMLLLLIDVLEHRPAGSEQPVPVWLTPRRVEPDHHLPAAPLLRGRRVRFLPLLQTALDRQVLRQAGAVYQFRHAALQDLLARPEGATGPGPAPRVAPTARPDLHQ